MAENTAVAGNPNAVSGIGEAVLAAGLLGENEKAEISLEQRLEHVEFAAELIKDADGTVTGVKLVPRKLVFDVSAFRTLLNEKDEPILSTKKPLNMDSSLMKRKYFTFRLPVPASVEERYANVEHEGEGVRQYTIAGSGNSRYIPVETWHLSRFTVTFTDQKLVSESPWRKRRRKNQILWGQRPLDPGCGWLVVSESGPYMAVQYLDRSGVERAEYLVSFQ